MARKYVRFKVVSQIESYRIIYFTYSMLVYATVSYTGQVTFHKIPETHGHV